MHVYLPPLPSSRLIQNNVGLPLCCFNTYADYVYDVKWSPKHPAVFASVDGSGRLQLWNLNNDFEVRMGMGTYSNASSLCYMCVIQLCPALNEACDIKVVNG